MKTTTVLISLLFGIVMASVGQIDKMRDRLDDADAEEQGLMTLRFFNAENGEPVPDASIDIQNIGQMNTDMEGKVRFDKLEDGVYPFTFSKDGFIEENIKFEVIAGTIFRNRFTVSPVIEMGSIRIVLDWENKPDDLDLHFKKEGAYHISYQDMKVADDGRARLDRDDRDGYGPETITVTDIHEKADYTCYVKDYSNKNRDGSKQLSKSKAMVKVYGESKLLNIWQLNEKQKGNTWMVFSIQHGKIVPTDQVNNYF